MTGVPHIENAAIGSSLQTCRDTLGQKWYYSVKRVEVEGKGTSLPIGADARFLLGCQGRQSWAGRIRPALGVCER